MNGFNPPITSAKIVQDGWRFSIPIYQRLFVWESEQIDRLLEDLWKARKTNKTKPYYVGVITTVEQDDGNKGRVFSVVDGQQRLTFLLLFFCDCFARWEAEGAKRFVFVNISDLRIKFLGRERDEDDIRRYVSREWDKMSNCNFRQFHDRMEVFFKKHKDEWETENKGKDSVIEWGDVIHEFMCYVYNKMSFLANELDGYSNADLNLYFEKMNSTGRQLSPLEQVKGLFAEHASEWNECFNFEKARKGKGTKTAREKNPGAEDDKSVSVQLDLKNDGVGIDIEKIVDWEGKVLEEPSSNTEAASFARLPMRPEVLALHALQLTLEGNDAWKENSTEAMKKGKLDYSPRHLIESFQTALSLDINVASSFMVTLKNYRDWIDDNIIFLRGEEESDGDEDSNSSGLKYAFRDASSQQDHKMLQLQSMLYVSSGEAQKWIFDAYASKPEKLFDFLRNWALARLPKDPNNFTYSPGMDRIVFWILDYLLWETVCDVSEGVVTIEFCNGFKQELDKDQVNTIKRYRFTQNRSVEHLHPQNPPNESEEWKADRKNNNDAVRNSFGNLCMISQSSNSGLSNEPVDVKFAKIRYALQGHPLQSIKLLFMFVACGGKDIEWTPQKTIEHGRNMLHILGFTCDAIGGWEQKLQLSCAKDK